MSGDEFGDYLDHAKRSPKFRIEYETVGAVRATVDALVNWRKENTPFTQLDVADLMGVAQSTVSEFEREASDPKLSTLQRYAQAVGLRLRVMMEPRLEQEQRFCLCGDTANFTVNTGLMGGLLDAWNTVHSGDGHGPASLEQAKAVRESAGYRPADSLNLLSALTNAIEGEVPDGDE